MPNVLLLMSDEHNPFYSSVAAHNQARTPNMERLAESGTFFRNAYCPSPLCMPSRSAFMAGRRVHEVQAYSNCNALVPDHWASYGQVLADQGVHTAYIGKTDVYAPGEELGFSEMMMPGDRGYPGDTNHRRTPVSIRKGSAGRADGYGTDENAGQGDVKCVDRAIQWLQNTAPKLDKPWTLTVNVTNPHFAHIAPPEFWALYDEGDLPDHGFECAGARHPYARDLQAHFETKQFFDEQIRGLRKGYRACVSFVDYQLGRLVDALEAEGLSEETDLIYASDHGEMLGKFGMWWKCSLYEDSVRVPCVAAGPSFDAGEVVETPVDLLDVQATLFDLVDRDRPDEWVGEPLRDIPADDRQRIVFSEYHGHGTRASAYVIRRGKWKYIHYVAAVNQLFDLEHDPDELENLCETEAEVAGELEAELRSICSPEEEDRRAEELIEQQLAAVGNG
ncbi:MAG: sulfatase-like hydrolase/transferase [Planctomycetes bacterium]|nr:sulfatase-like hydrolase/transferase [Planctomycetota bacterium]